LIPKLSSAVITPESEPPPGFNPLDLKIYGYTEESHSLLSVALDVSGRCNLACRYCAEAATQPKRKPMTVEVLEAAIQLLDFHARSEIPLSIRIGSGEPLLAQSLLKHLHALLEKIPSKIDVYITTNGTLIDKNVADWLADTGWRIKISLDGPMPIHDTWRHDRSGRPTYKRVVQAVDLMVERCPDRTSVASVLCRGTNPADVFNEIAALGVRRIELLPVAYQLMQNEYDIRLSAEDVNNYVDFVSYYARALAQDGAGVHPVLVRFLDSVLKVMGFGNTAVPCGAGRSYACVGPDGNLYPCFRFVGIDRYIIGNIDKGFDKAAISKFQKTVGRTFHHRPLCNSCWGASICGGPCFALAEFFGTGKGEPDRLHCQYKLADARAAFYLVSYLRETDLEKLMRFLPVKLDLP